MLDNIAKNQIMTVIYEIKNTKAISLLTISHDLANLKKCVIQFIFLTMVSLLKFERNILEG